jgi:hypothetical protein
VNPPDSVSLAQFFCLVHGEPTGPFDIVELASQLKCAQINAATPVRREGEDGWIPFGDLPEFATAHQMPVEEIALHLERKEQAKRPKRKPYLTWFISAVVVFLVVDLWLLVNSQTGPPTRTSATAPSSTGQPAWLVTKSDFFSVECPVVLMPRSPPGFKFILYYGILPKRAAFHIWYVKIADIPTIKQFPKFDSTDELIYYLADSYIGGIRSHKTSERDFTQDGNQGREFSYAAGTSAYEMSGRLRIIVGKVRIFAVFVEAAPSMFSDENMNHYLDSFQVIDTK